MANTLHTFYVVVKSRNGIDDFEARVEFFDEYHYGQFKQFNSLTQIETFSQELANMLGVHVTMYAGVWPTGTFNKGHVFGHFQWKP